MDTSISSVDFRVYDLWRSADPDEYSIGKKAAEVIGELMTQLRPILKHVAAPIPVLPEDCAVDGCSRRNSNIRDPYYARRRGLLLLDEVEATKHATKKFLFLGENGGFFLADLCHPLESREIPRHFHIWMEGNPDDPAWDRAEFGKLIGALKRVLAEATQKREEHLVSIRERAAKLDEILEILRRHV